MKKQLMKVGIILFVTSSIFASCSKDGDPGPEGPEGPQGIAGEKGDQGETGTANATLYKFDGHNFEVTDNIAIKITMTEEEMTESAWLVYMTAGTASYHYYIPGYGSGGSSEYRVYNDWKDDEANIIIKKATGPGELYKNIYIIRIAVGSVVDNTSSKMSGYNVPGDLDVSNYVAVKAYYNIID